LFIGQTGKSKFELNELGTDMCQSLTAFKGAPATKSVARAAASPITFWNHDVTRDIAGYLLAGIHALEDPGGIQP
jgi:hypothetical protein